MLLLVVGSCCAKFETGQTFIPVQKDPSIVGQQLPALLGVVASVCAILKKNGGKLHVSRYMHVNRLKPWLTAPRGTTGDNGD